jgi:RNA polymerase-binding transcription factor DksA
MSEVLRQIGKIEVEHLFDEAETYICALCDMERKPCEIHAGTKCAMMIREGTELEILRSAEKKQSNNLYGTCISCGEKIGRLILSRNPLAELCRKCSPPPRRISA